MPRLTPLAVAVAAVALHGCERSPAGPESVPTPVAAATPVSDGSAAAGWNPQALASAEAVARRIREAGRACEGYYVYDYALTAKDYGGRLPLPAAMTSCDGDEEEDIEIVVFSSPEAKTAFVETKRQLICTAAEKKGVRRFPGFPYVDGGTWTVQPDTKDAAERIARGLGAEAKVAGCGD